MSTTPTERASAHRSEQGTVSESKSQSTTDGDYHKLASKYKKLKKCYSSLIYTLTELLEEEDDTDNVHQKSGKGYNAQSDQTKDKPTENGKEAESTSSPTSKSSQSSKKKHKSISPDSDSNAPNLKKKFHKAMRALVEEDNNLSHSSNSEGDVHNPQYQFANLEDTGLLSSPVLAQGTVKDLDLRNVILLDSQSRTLDVFCNKKLVNNIIKTRDITRLKSNGGVMIPSPPEGLCARVPYESVVQQGRYYQYCVLGEPPQDVCRLLP
jgi:hypothetical protein